MEGRGTGGAPPGREELVEKASPVGPLTLRHLPNEHGEGGQSRTPNLTRGEAHMHTRVHAHTHTCAHPHPGGGLSRTGSAGLPGGLGKLRIP